MGEMFENMNEIRDYQVIYHQNFCLLILYHPLELVMHLMLQKTYQAKEPREILEFSLMKARLEIYYENIPSNSLRNFKERFNENPSDSNKYGLALAYQKNNQYKESIALIENLISLYPKNLVLNNTKIDIFWITENMKMH